MRVALAVALAVAARLAVGAEPPSAPEPAPEPEKPAGEPWVVVSTRPILVRVRGRPGTRVKEIWASGVLAAPAAVLQETLLDGESFPRFMPYVKEVRVIPVATTDGSWFAYQRVSPPLVAERDAVFHIFIDSSLAPDGTGHFRNHWNAVPDMVPSAPGAVRTPLSSGSWEVHPLEPGSSRAVYRFLVDPGGNIPSWLADMGNRSGIAEVFQALETEARRRAAQPRRPVKKKVEAKAADAADPDAGSATPASP